MKKAFTLVEILVVLALLSCLLVFGALSYSSVNSRAGLRSAAAMIVADLRHAQQKALSSKEQVSVVFEESSYQMQGIKRTLPRNVRIAAPRTVRFASSGRPVPGYFGAITLRSGAGEIKIVISNVGRIRTE